MKRKLTILFGAVLMVTPALAYPPAPALDAPPNDWIVENCTSWGFMWNPIYEYQYWDDYINRYHFQVLLNDSVIFDSYPGNMTPYASMDFAELPDNATYSWRARTYGYDGWWDITLEWSPWSGRRYFHTRFYGMDAYSPVNGSTIYTQRPTFKWTDHCGIDAPFWDKFQIDDNDDFSSPVFEGIFGDANANNGVVAPDQGPALAPGVTYYWRAACDNDIIDVHTGWTNVTSFIIDCGNPWAPDMVGPANGAEISGDHTTLSWDPIMGVVQYNIQFDDDDGFISCIADEWITATSYDVSALEQGARYYWRVRIEYDCGYSGWAATRNFTVECPTLAAPTLTDPPDGADNQPAELTYLEWDEVAGAEIYCIQIDDNSSFSNIEPGLCVYQTDQINQLCSGLGGETTYYWRVRSYEHVCGSGDWSPIRSFTTGSMTDIGQTAADVLPDSYRLGQNYPNPFNLATSIEFSLPRSEEVTIDIHNTLGSRVKIFELGRIPAGTRTITWDGLDDRGLEVPSGIYFYQIRAGEFTDAKKMMLIK